MIPRGRRSRGDLVLDVAVDVVWVAVCTVVVLYEATARVVDAVRGRR